jgi:hypothetical protein
MISLQRIEANRRNALRSTGPRTEEGKQRSRLNAVRHGLTAETVVGNLEDADDYKAFEAAIISDNDPETAVGRELVLRLASLLWRLRRANAIEADLFEIHAKATREIRPGIDLPTQASDEPVAHVAYDQAEEPSNDAVTREYKETIRHLTQSFLRLAELDSRAFERLNRYEAALWRQTKQTLYALHPTRYR